MGVDYSVIIPAKNAEETLDACLASLSKMQYPKDRYEVIVVDDGSTDRTANVAEAHDARLLKQRCTSIAAVRNFGAEQARGRVLAHLDSDMEVDPRWLERADAYFGEGYEGALFFDDQAPEGSCWIAKIWYGKTRIKRRAPKKVDFLPTRNLFVNKKIHDELGGFDEALFKGGRGGSDKELTFRIFKAGYDVTSDPTLQMIHNGCERNFLEFLGKEWWRQGNTLFVAKSHGYPLRLLKNPIFSAIHLVLMVTAVALLVIAPGYGWIALLLWLLPSVMILLKRMDLKSPPWVLAQAWMATFVRWNVAGVALVAQLLRGTRS